VSDRFGKVNALTRGEGAIGVCEFLQQVVPRENTELASFRRKPSEKNHERFSNYHLPN